MLVAGVLIGLVIIWIIGFLVLVTILVCFSLVLAGVNIKGYYSTMIIPLIPYIL